MFLHILSFVGALGIFLYGMKIMSEGLEKTAGDRLRGVLSSMTSNRFAGVLTGMGVTAVIQSSSATTVMVVSFVNAGLMTLRQAIGVIMGANIGTTITGQLIALDVGELAPLMAFIGVAAVVFLKNDKPGNATYIMSLQQGLYFLNKIVREKKNKDEKTKKEKEVKANKEI